MSTPTSIPLTFVEEMVLLSLDDATGASLPVPIALRYALAGAVICDLAWLNRIDTDPDRLFVLTNTTTCDPILDHALYQINSSPDPRSVGHWLRLIADEASFFNQAALERLVARGILSIRENRILWVFKQRRYPTLDQQERVEVRTRLAALILGDDLPDPRDALLLSLLSSCRLTEVIFPEPRFAARAARIAQLTKLDLVGREVSVSIKAITALLSESVPCGM